MLVVGCKITISLAHYNFNIRAIDIMNNMCDMWNLVDNCVIECILNLEYEYDRVVYRIKLTYLGKESKIK